jgi:hypothetical protein
MDCLAPISGVGICAHPSALELPVEMLYVPRGGTDASFLRYSGIVMRGAEILDDLAL